MLQVTDGKAEVFDYGDSLHIETKSFKMGTVGMNVRKDGGAIGISFEQFEREFGGPVIYIDLTNEDGVPHILVFEHPGDEEPVEFDLRNYL
jgi:hypothetical protein